MRLANRIRIIREAKGFTQEEIATKLNISSSAYGQIERKAQNSSFNTLMKISKSLEVSLPFLLDIDSNEFIENNKL